MGSDSFIETPPSIKDWLKKAKDFYGSNLETPTKVVGVIGKDYPDHSKTENINCYLREPVFPLHTFSDETLSIRAHYSEKESILFLVINGLDDVENLQNVFSTNNNSKPKSFFEKLASSESSQHRMLHFLFLSCHFIIIFEQTSRIDLEFLRTLKKVNSSRLIFRARVNEKLILSDLKSISFSSKSLSSHEREGRIVIPKLLFAFQKNNVRSDLGSAKKREIYEKLEKSLENQLIDILKSYQLTENGGDSLCQINPSLAFAHLINPEMIQRDAIQEMLEVLLEDPDQRELPKLPTNNSFSKFLDDHFRLEKHTAKLESVIDALQCFSCILDGSLDKEGRVKMDDFNVALQFERRLHDEHIKEAIRIYEKDTTSNRNVNRREGIYHQQPRNQIRTKTEHDAKFTEAVLYLKSVIGSHLDEALEVLQKRCDEVWQSDLRACEQISLTGTSCVKKVHPTFGDTTYPEYRWTAHESTETLISTCACGGTQGIRNDPFTLKEANCDFYENNPDFTCCRRLEKLAFKLFKDATEEKDDFNDWVDRESNSLRETKKGHKRRDFDEELGATSESAYYDEDTIVDNTDDNGSVSDDNTTSELTASSTDSDPFYSGRRDAGSFSGTVKSSRDLVIDFIKKMNSLKLHDSLFIEDVPNSLTKGKLPLFPSWILTCLGDSSIYSHSEGLRSQPNFKIGGEYLTPAVVMVNCDTDVWNRDLGRMRNEEYNQRFISKPKPFEEFAKVKLFVGFEYECSRGHRFFVDHYGEPLLYRKGANVVRESGRRNSLSEIVNADLPLRRACTCRKLPLKSAQLMKIHLVTPKAPVHITIDPRIQVPGHSGEYNTGQGPLELSHSKYYILQLPMVYSSSSGTYIHDKTNLDKIGVWKGGAIKVVHKPVVSLRW